MQPSAAIDRAADRTAWLIRRRTGRISERNVAFQAASTARPTGPRIALNPTISEVS
jgi:hypothetical protein